MWDAHQIGLGKCDAGALQLDPSVSDGWRARASFAPRNGSYGRATQIAAWIGQALAFVFGFIGLFSNPLLIFIALFIFLGAQQEAAMAQMKDLSLNLAGLRGDGYSLGKTSSRGHVGGCC